ncbi:SMI1/KNR4 family protein [Actinomadura spongiicola]|uniref:SMI1/KNR4 family protein n=1 Tax=Actinomadura spongiicola TaxID=2303421 RepID=A0A372GB81_9ACTN|nr:SMI1/KNR4 family protein [Actinomadura spongiicola]RFS82644.1 SMI1/KNR4 family protein [Actinomadura spongiicola]
MTDIDDIVQRVAARATSDGDSLPTRVSDERIAEAERQLGFALHPLLVRLYREVADGGFGPDYQLLPLLGPGSSVVGEYLERREASVGVRYPEWPEGVVPILTWGCGMYAGIDCFNEAGQVLLFEPNPYGGGSWDECWFLDSASLEAWLETWLAGTGWFEEDASDQGDLVEPQPWTEAATRLPTGA